MTKVH